MASARALRSMLLAAPMAMTFWGAAVAAPETAAPPPAAPASAPAAADAPTAWIPAEPLHLGAFLAAQYALDAGDDDVAVENFRQALSADPTNPDLLRRAMATAAVEGHLAEAVKLAERLLAATPKDLAATLVLVADDILHDKPDAAAKRLEALEAVGAQDGLALPLVRAWVAAARKDLAGARAALKPLTGSTVLAPLGLTHEGLIADVLGDTAAATAAFDKVVAGVSKEDGAAWREAELLGAFYERNNRRPQAIELYKSVLLRDADAPQVAPAVARAAANKPAPRPIATAKDGLAEALFDIAAVAQRREQGSGVAMMNLQMALALKPNNPLGLTLLGELYERRNRPERAIETYRRIPAAEPLSWRARMRIAYDLDALNRTDEAVTLLEGMAAERPDREDVLTELGDLMRHRQRWDAAISAYDRALKRAPKLEQRHWSTLFSRAIAHERTKKLPQAVADLEQALKLEPDQPYMLNYLGYTWVEEGVHFDRAETMIKRAVELRPNDGHIVDSLGWFYYRRNDFAKAVQLLEKAVELKPVEATINDHLGDAYWKAGRENEARGQWARALTMDPDADDKPAIEAKVKAGRWIDPATLKAAAKPTESKPK